MTPRKRQWSKPQLIVLGRGKPEENVLAGCKNPTVNGSGGKKCSNPSSGSCLIGVTS